MKIARSPLAPDFPPAMGFAAGCSDDKRALSCAAGTVYVASNRCVAATT